MLKQTRRKAEQGAALWDEHWRQFGTIRYDARGLRWDGLLDLVRARMRAGRMLEAGCGLGRYLLYIDTEGGDIVGVDFVSEPLQRVHAHRPGSKLAVADLGHLPFPAASFATILCLGVLEHFEHGPEAQMRQLVDALEPGGWLILTVPYANLLKRRRARLRDANIFAAADPLPSDQSFYQYCFTRREARRLILDAGLELVAERRVSRLFWLLGASSTRKGSGRPAPGAVVSGSRESGTRGALRGLAREVAYHAQWLIPGDWTAHMVAVVGQKQQDHQSARTRA
jgi:SAM-dependent methyltransferase